MFDVTFENDALARRVVRGLLIAELLVIILAFVFVLLRVPSLALLASILTLVGFGVVLIWLYLRYCALPSIREKRDLTAQASALKAKVAAEQNRISAAARKRDELAQARLAELSAALKDLQHHFIDSGLTSTLIAQADIPGIGPKLKERLAANGIRSAADVNSKVTSVEGFGQAKTQAVLDWHSGILSRLDQSKPGSLPAGQQSGIDQKYQALDEKNNLAESRAVDDKNKLEAELEPLNSRLGQLAPYTFYSYIGRSIYQQANAPGKRQASRLLIGLPVGGACLVAICGLFGLSSLGGTAQNAALQQSVDHNAIATSAMQTALAFSLSTVSARTSTPLPTATLIPSTVPPTDTATPIAPNAGLLAIKGASCIPPNPPQKAKVVEVVDGDTVKVLLADDGKTYSMRYIGMDTPEMNQGSNFAAEARAMNSQLVYGKDVLLFKDTSETDRYNRLLRYVVADKAFVNYDLVVQGYAKVASYPPDTACISAFQAAEQMVSAMGIGIWAPEPTLVPVILPTSPGTGGAACNCDGPDLDCADFSTHAKAQACYNYCVSQGYGDVFRLDGNDNDGLACERLP